MKIKRYMNRKCLAQRLAHIKSSIYMRHHYCHDHNWLKMSLEVASLVFSVVFIRFIELINFYNLFFNVLIMLL